MFFLRKFNEEKIRPADVLGCLPAVVEECLEIKKKGFLMKFLDNSEELRILLIFL